MQEFRNSLIRMIIIELIPAVIVGLVLIFASIFARKFLIWLEITHIQIPVYVIIALLFCLNFFWTYSTVSKLCIDLSQNAFDTYVGEVEYMDQKSSKYTDVFCLSDFDDLCIETGYGSVDATIQRCKARVVYTKHSKKMLEIQVYEVLEKRSTVVFR